MIEALAVVLAVGLVVAGEALDRRSRRAERVWLRDWFECEQIHELLIARLLRQDPPSERRKPERPN
jgi:hypothetical protein